MNSQYKYKNASPYRISNCPCVNVSKVLNKKNLEVMTESTDKIALQLLEQLVG